MGKVDSNFTKVRNAINALEQSGGGSSGGGETTQGPLRILAIGNSFTKCTMAYVGRLCNNLGVTNVTIQRLYRDGSSLKGWCGKDTANPAKNVDLTATLTTYDVVIASGDTRKGNGTLAQILNHQWDYIMLQQVSTDADDYTTYEPYLSELIDYILTYCPNKDVRFIWNLTWQVSGAAYSDIVSAVKTMMEEHGHSFDIIVPTGTAMQNVRATTIAQSTNINGGSANNFTRDGKHINGGVGDYVLACTFYTSVIQPFSGISIYDDTMTTHTLTEEQASSSSNKDYDVSGEGASTYVGAVQLTDENRLTCQKCAVYATIRPFATTDIDNL